MYGFLQDKTGDGVYGAVQTAVDSARAEGADYVIVMAHLGNEAECSPWTYADVISHTAGIDALLDGHSHDTEQVIVKDAAGKDIPRSACGTRMECIGWCGIEPDGGISTGLYGWGRETSAQETLGLDNEMSLAVAAATDELNETLKRVVAQTDVTLTVSDPEAVDTTGGTESKFQYRLARIAHIVNEARASDAYDGVLFLDGGDIYQGMPVSNFTGGAALRAAFDAMDYDAVALGNHEFDWDVTQYCADADATLLAYRIGGYTEIR